MTKCIGRGLAFLLLFSLAAPAVFAVTNGECSPNYKRLNIFFFLYKF
jgi:hypothetical protein